MDQLVGFRAMPERHHLTMPDLPDELLHPLLDLIDRLRQESADFLAEPGDPQRWYNRGYANGMVIALRELGQGDRLDDRVIDDPVVLGGQIATPWGKAYRHGERMGSRETYEITGTQAP